MKGIFIFFKDIFVCMSISGVMWKTKATCLRKIKFNTDAVRLFKYILRNQKEV